MSAQNSSIGSFNDPFDYSPFGGTYGLESYDTKEQADAAYGKEYVSSGNSIWEKISDGLGLTDHKARYENWKTERDRAYERAATNSARAWDEYMESTKYQRMVEDLKKAGLNPWLAVNSGVGSGGITTTASSGSSARSKSDKDDKNAIAAFLGAAAKIISALILA